MIKLVLLDVDGTITDPNRVISTRAIESIRKVQNEGVKVSLASGNVLPVMYGLKIFLGLNSPVFAENGGVMYQDEMEVFFSREMPKKVFESLEKEGVLEGILSNKWRETSYGYFPVPGKEDYIASIAEKADLVTVDSGYSWHLLNRAQDKGFAMEHLKEMYGLDYDEILVMGDSYNDFPMFRKEVFKAAPGNARESLKEISDYVAKSSNGDGVAEVLSNLSSF